MSREPVLVSIRKDLEAKRRAHRDAAAAQRKAARDNAAASPSGRPQTRPAAALAPELDVDAFQAVLEEVAAKIPEPLLRELNGGFMTLPQAKRHPQAPGSYILGEYCVQLPGLGRYIKLYYGSFRAVYGARISRARLYAKLEETVAHELLHHMESLAGERDLEIQDAIQLRRLRGEFPS